MLIDLVLEDALLLLFKKKNYFALTIRRWSFFLSRVNLDPVFVIMEYVCGGKLQSFLRKSRADHYYGNLYGASSHLSSRDLTSFAYQVSRAMEFLANKGVRCFLFSYWYAAQLRVKIN